MSGTEKLKAAVTDALPVDAPINAKLAQLKRQLGALSGELRPILQGVNPATFEGAAWAAVLANTDLLHADRGTFFAAVRRAAADGLLPDGKEAVLNVYNTKVKEGGRETWVKKVEYIPMVGGLVKKLYASGEVTSLDAAAVYEKDVFQFERGDDVRLKHIPTMDDDPGKIIAAYLRVTLKNGEIKREVMPRRDIERIRLSSKAPNGPGWTNWYDQFAIKSVVKRGYKQLPKIEALERLIESDNEITGNADVHTAPDRAAITQEPITTINDIVGPLVDAAPTDQDPVPVSVNAGESPAPNATTPNDSDEGGITTPGEAISRMWSIHDADTLELFPATLPDEVTNDASFQRNYKARLGELLKNQKKK
jgi:phage RecT family recombinase